MSQLQNGPSSRYREHVRSVQQALTALLFIFAPVTIHAACVSTTISTHGLNFGVFSSFAQMTFNGTVTLSCVGTGRNPYTIALTTGNSGSYALRRMRSGANLLPYNLYTDESYTQIWGDGTGGSAVVSGSLDLDTSQPSGSVSHTVYGRVPNLPRRPAAGIYTDSIMVTINY